MLMFTLSLLVGLCAATEPSYGYGNPEQSLAERVDILNSLLDTRERVESIQLFRLASLRDSSNQNLDVVNNFNAYIYPEITLEQYQQNARLAHLTGSLANIDILRAWVGNLSSVVDHLNDEVAHYRNWTKDTQNDINCLQNDDIAQQNEIDLAAQRADALNDRIDALDEGIDENQRSLFVVELNVRRVIDSINRQGASADSISVQPNSDSPIVTAVFDPIFVGEPHFSAVGPIGFHISNPHSYGQTGYPSFYFGVQKELWNTRADITAVDMSAGGWMVDNLNLDIDHIYFDTTVFSKSLLEGITTVLQ